MQYVDTVFLKTDICFFRSRFEHEKKYFIFPQNSYTHKGIIIIIVVV